MAPHTERVEAQPRYVVRTAKIVGTATLVGLAALGAREIVSRAVDLFQDDSHQSKHHNQSLEGLETYYSFNNSDFEGDDAWLLIDQYNVARDSFANFSLYELKTNHTSETTDFIKDGRKKLLLDGARIFSLLATDKETVQIGNDEDWVEVQGIKFDLDNSYHEFLLDGVINNSILMYASDAPDLQVYDANERRADLLWIAHEDLPIEIADDAWGFAPENVFINMARFYQKIKALGYPVPSHMFFQFHKPDDPGGAWYYDELNDLYVTNESGDASIVHEWAHNQSDENPKFSLKSYNDAFFNEEIWDKAYSPDSFINTGVLDSKNHEGTMIEDYAENLRVFFEDGIGYRRRLKELFLINSPSYKLLLAKYSYAQKFYGGDEFLTKGERFLPRKGDTFVINDPDQSYSGICLRPRPSYHVHVAPNVYDGDLVEVLDGPIETVGPFGSDTRQMYKVAYVQYLPDGSKKIFLNNDEGWIWKMWLGDRELPAKIANKLPTINSLVSLPDGAC